MLRRATWAQILVVAAESNLSEATPLFRWEGFPYFGPALRTAIDIYVGTATVKKYFTVILWLFFVSEGYMNNCITIIGDYYNFMHGIHQTFSSCRTYLFW